MNKISKLTKIYSKWAHEKYNRNRGLDPKKTMINKIIPLLENSMRNTLDRTKSQCNKGNEF